MNPRKLLITGAAGRIGRTMVREASPVFQVVAADIVPSPVQSHGVAYALLDIRDRVACDEALAGVDAVLHLAADASPDAGFESSILPNNIVGAFNVMAAAARAGCGRFVFASSAQAVEGYPIDVQVTEAMAPRPKNVYGAGKAFGEALAACFALTSPMVCVAVRIANLADFAPGESHSARDVAAFISERDLTQLLMKALTEDLEGFHVLHGVSDNRHKRLAIDATRKTVGYAPRDDSFKILEGRQAD